ncbi:TonB-dependent receptor [Nitritalea halalkaliphila]|uniref:TonB-dependent receptor n=1 Tax=Nitritalea halalkaliphila TaxID=590849 RepID=UPI0002E68FEA|nr:TonB-dependent receptor [Nitritalea halalkaliphila]
MKNCFWLLGLVLFFSQPAVLWAQGTVELKGVVRDAQTKETLPGANVLVVGAAGSGMVTDIEGRFQLDVAQLPVDIQVSFIGFETLTLRISSSEEAANLDIALRSDEVALEEVVISGRAPDTNVRSMDIGRSQVPISTIKNIPALFGEVDVLRSLQLLPGVTNAGEGTTGLFVRGGSADQNLLQLDGAPVYNPSHFFGFFSVFNPDALDQIDFFKGNIPATFGGRASSVIDIGLKEGNFDAIKGEGGLGIISSKLTVDGPLFGENSSFIVSARRTYADVFLRFANDPNVRNNQLYFYDLSGKLTFRLGDRDKLTVSAYGGRDLLGFNEQFRLGWQNQLASVKWTRSIRSDFFFDLNLYQSFYDYEVAFTDPDIGFDWTNRLGETGLRAAWTISPIAEARSTGGFIPNTIILRR